MACIYTQRNWRSSKTSSAEKKQVLRLHRLSVEIPHTLEEALQMLSDGLAIALAGGTDVLRQARMDNHPQRLVNIAGLSELQQIVDCEGGLHIGAGVCFSALVAHPLVQARYPLLVTACNTIGSLPLRNSATLGGCIIHAAPCADTLPPLMVYDAEVVLKSVRGARCMLLSEFIVSGYRTRLAADELMLKIILSAPQTRPLQQRYRQRGGHDAPEMQRQSLAGQIALTPQGAVDYCRLVAGGLLSKPLRLLAVEQALLGSTLHDALIIDAGNALTELVAAANREGSMIDADNALAFLEMQNEILGDVLAERKTEQTHQAALRA